MVEGRKIKDDEEEKDRERAHFPFSPGKELVINRERAYPLKMAFSRR